MSPARRVLFLPGASGDGRFWRPVADRLPGAWAKVLLHWPGLGRVPARPGVAGFEDLGRLVLEEAGPAPVDLVAQSMGGVVAALVALASPARVRRLVLAATSGGIDLAPFAPLDWRPDYAREFPGAAAWVRARPPDLSTRLGSLGAPTLLLWSDADPISPLGVGRRLAQLLPRAELVVIPGVGHMFARDRADLVAPHVHRHLACGPGEPAAGAAPPPD
jgi:pimeloyl-ACP methyl ester carboxylesterase